MIQQIAIIHSLVELVRETEKDWRANLAGCERDGTNPRESASVKESFTKHTTAKAALLRALQCVVPMAPRKYVGENRAEADSRFRCEVMDAILAEENHLTWDWRPDTGGLYLWGVKRIPARSRR